MKAFTLNVGTTSRAWVTTRLAWMFGVGGATNIGALLAGDDRPGTDMFRM